MWVMCGGWAVFEGWLEFPRRAWERRKEGAMRAPFIIRFGWLTNKNGVSLSYDLGIRFSAIDGARIAGWKQYRLILFGYVQYCVATN